MTGEWIDYFYWFMNSLGYRHPLHPALVHLPMGLVMAAFFFGWAGRLAHRETFSRTALHCIVLAFLSWFPVVLLGLMDWQHFYGRAPLFPVEMKMMLAGVLVVLFVVAMALGFREGPGPWSAVILYTFCFFTVGLIGFYGAELVYTKRAVTGDDAYRAGATIFENNCVMCHPKGQNIIRPDRPVITSSKLKEFGAFRSWIRNPVKPMPRFAETRISDFQARELYGYITHVLVPSKGSNPAEFH